MNYGDDSSFNGLFRNASSDVTLCSRIALLAFSEFQ